MTILLIEDSGPDVVNVQRTCRRLDSTWVVIQFSQAESAIDYLRNPAVMLPDVVLLDMNLGGEMDGQDFLEYLSTQRIELPVYLFLGSPSEWGIWQEQGVTCTGWINKSAALGTQLRPVVRASALQRVT